MGKFFEILLVLIILGPLVCILLPVLAVGLILITGIIIQISVIVFICVMAVLLIPISMVFCGVDKLIEIWGSKNEEDET